MTTATQNFPKPGVLGAIIAGIAAMLLLLGMAISMPQTSNPPPPSGGGGGNCPNVDLAEFVIDVMMYGGPNGTPSYFTVSKVGVDYNLAGVLFSISEEGYPALGAGKTQVWHTYVNTAGSGGSVSATELLRAGDLYIKQLKTQGVSQYREIKDINNLSYSSYKACGDIIKSPLAIDELFDDGTIRKVQYWGFTIK